MKKLISLLVFVALCSVFARANNDADKWATAIIKLGNCCKIVKNVRTVDVDDVLFTIVDKDPMENYKKIINSNY